MSEHDKPFLEIQGPLTPGIIITLIVCVTVALLGLFVVLGMGSTADDAHTLACTKTCVVSAEPKECIQACRGVDEAFIKITHGPAEKDGSDE